MQPTPKEIAWSFFQKLSAGQIDDALAMLDDRGTWWNVGPRTSVPMATFKVSAAAIMGMLPMRFTLHHSLAEGPTAFLELESVSPRPGGGTYNNRYCYVMETAAGRILHVREYPDTKYSFEMLPPEAWSHEQRSWERHHGRYWPKEPASDDRVEDET